MAFIKLSLKIGVHINRSMERVCAELSGISRIYIGHHRGMHQLLAYVIWGQNILHLVDIIMKRSLFES